MVQRQDASDQRQSAGAAEPGASPGRLRPGGYTSEKTPPPRRPKYGLDKPVIELKITAGGKVQRAVLSQQGEHYYAARDGDASTYEIAPLEVQDLRKFIADL